MKGRNRAWRTIRGGSLGFLLSISVSVQAQAQAQAQAQECEPKTYKELVQCALQTSSAIEVTDRQLKSAEELPGVSGQFINPELEGETLQSSGKSETSASLLFTLELGGKRSARKNEALAEVQKAKASTELSRAGIRLSLIEKLYRLSQLKREKAIAEESFSTFTKIVNQYQKRPALNPEQEVSLSIFKMAVSDQQLRLSRLKSEEEKVLQELLATTKLKKEQIVSNLPTRRTDWPSVNDDASAEAAPQTQIAHAELLSAQSLHAKEVGESWPNLRVGPSLKVQNDGAGEETFYGVAVSLPLPLLSLNQSGRAFGRAKVAEAETSFRLVKSQIAGTRRQLVKTYRETVASLGTAIGSKEIEERHLHVERHFFKGLVPSSLVIEAHRQLFDLEERRNEAERTALEALGSIYIIDNSFSEIIL